jgi:hypothetical protein
MDYNSFWLQSKFDQSSLLCNPVTWLASCRHQFFICIVVIIFSLSSIFRLACQVHLRHFFFPTTRTLVRALSTISTSPSESESEYSDMSSAPLLDYPSGICVVFKSPWCRNPNRFWRILKSYPHSRQVLHCQIWRMADGYLPLAEMPGFINNWSDYMYW